MPIEVARLNKVRVRSWDELLKYYKMQRLKIAGTSSKYQKLGPQALVDLRKIVRNSIESKEARSNLYLIHPRLVFELMIAILKKEKEKGSDENFIATEFKATIPALKILLTYYKPKLIRDDPRKNIPVILDSLIKITSGKEQLHLINMKKNFEMKVSEIKKTIARKLRSNYTKSMLDIETYFIDMLKNLDNNSDRAITKFTNLYVKGSLETKKDVKIILKKIIMDNKTISKKIIESEVKREEFRVKEEDFEVKSGELKNFINLIDIERMYFSDLLNKLKSGNIYNNMSLKGIHEILLRCNETDRKQALARNAFERIKEIVDDEYDSGSKFYNSPLVFFDKRGMMLLDFYLNADGERRNNEPSDSEEYLNLFMDLMKKIKEKFNQKGKILRFIKIRSFNRKIKSLITTFGNAEKKGDIYGRRVSILIKKVQSLIFKNKTTNK